MLCFACIYLHAYYSPKFASNLLKFDIKYCEKETRFTKVTRFKMIVRNFGKFF
jgi:hypothetical protein